MSDAAPKDGSELVSRFIPTSPFSAELGIELIEIADGHARLRLPYSERVTTFGDVVHGGAISTLVDVAAMATAWAGAPLPDEMRGATVSLAIDFVGAARAETLVADGKLLRRGRSLCHCEVDVTGEDGRLVAKALATYKVG
jgi:uncharacterized protein (TIGR00369 family)